MQVETNHNVVNGSVSGALVAVCLAIAGCGGSGSSGGVGGVGGGQDHGGSGGGIGDLSPGPNERASLFDVDTEANFQSQKPAVDSNGRYVAFESDATNLVVDDTNAARDIFLRDTELDTTQRVSQASGGVQANGSSSAAAISADGRYVAFESLATNLVAVDGNATRDIFSHDTVTDTTGRVSVSSADGDSNGASFDAAISPDGRYVGFESDANNLLASGDSNFLRDVFLHDMSTGVTGRASVNSDEEQAIGGDSAAAAVSSNGSYVAFQSAATNLVPGDTNGVFDGDTNAVFDVFRRDTVAGETIRVSVTSLSAQANFQSVNPDISADGRYVVFESDATDLVTGDTNAARDIFVRDTVLNTTERVSISDDEQEANLGSSIGVISDDGRYVAFQSVATNLVSTVTNGLTHIFVRDRVAGRTVLFSTDDAGTQGNLASRFPALSGFGRRIAFESDATNLVTDDLNAATDVFVRDTTN
jgi:Tol biopolymer transport system component